MGAPLHLFNQTPHPGWALRDSRVLFPTLLEKDTLLPPPLGAHVQVFLKGSSKRIQILNSGTPYQIVLQKCLP